MTILPKNQQILKKMWIEYILLKYKNAKQCMHWQFWNLRTIFNDVVKSKATMENFIVIKKNRAAKLIFIFFSHELLVW